MIAHSAIPPRLVVGLAVLVSVISASFVSMRSLRLLGRADAGGEVLEFVAAVLVDQLLIALRLAVRPRHPSPWTLSGDVAVMFAPSWSCGARLEEPLEARERPVEHVGRAVDATAEAEDLDVLGVDREGVLEGVDRHVVQVA